MKNIPVLTCGGALALVGLLAQGPALLQLLTLDASRIQTLVEFRASRPETHSVIGTVIKAKGVQIVGEGFAMLDRKSNGFLAYPLPENLIGLVTLHLSAKAEDGLKLAVVLDTPASDQFHIIQHPWDIRHQDVNLTPHLKGAFQQLILSATGDDRGRYFMVEEFVVKNISKLYFYPAIDILLMAVLVLVLVGHLLKRQPQRILWGGAGVCAGVGIVGLLNPMGFLASPWFWRMLLIALVSADFFYHTSDRRLKYSPVLLLLALAFCIRWRALAGTVGQELEGDAIGYFGLLSSLQWTAPWALSVREPLYIWIQWLAGLIFGRNWFIFRVVTVLFSVANVALGYVLLEKISGRKGPAFVGALLLALGQFIVWNSLRGERNELYLTLLMGFWILILSPASHTFVRSFLAGLLAGLAALTWLIGGLACVLAYAFLRFKKAPRFGPACAFGFVFLLLVGPHLYQQWKTYGDPLASVNAHTNFYRDTRLTGQPSGEGPGRSFLSYVFGEERGRIVPDTIKGYVNLFLNPGFNMNRALLGFTGAKSLAVYPFLLAGLFFTLRRRQFTIYLLAFATLNVSVAFLENIFDPRLFLHAAPFVAYFVGVGAAEVFGKASQFIRAQPFGRHLFKLP